MRKNMAIRSQNKGLTVKINLWSLEKAPPTFNAEAARLWIKGQAQNLGTGEKFMFNDAGGLISGLGKWNSQKLQELKSAKEAAKKAFSN
jgi:hypothetical protein